MAEKNRTIEIFSAGCSVCEDVIWTIRCAACPSCDIKVLDMKVPDVQLRAADLGVMSVPAVAVDGKLVECCKDRGVDLNALRAAGLGRPVI